MSVAVALLLGLTQYGCASTQFEAAQTGDMVPTDYSAA